MGITLKFDAIKLLEVQSLIPTIKFLNAMKLEKEATHAN
jgi:hypothetical protein